MVKSAETEHILASQQNCVSPVSAFIVCSLYLFAWNQFGANCCSSLITHILFDFNSEQSQLLPLQNLPHTRESLLDAHQASIISSSICT